MSDLGCGIFRVEWRSKITKLDFCKRSKICIGNHNTEQTEIGKTNWFKNVNNKTCSPDVILSIVNHFQKW